jgi:type VI secretion system secreted protein Hcp
MAFPAFFSVKGSRQGQFKAEAQEAQRSDKWMVVLNFAMEVGSPHDLASGQPLGRRQWKPIKVVKEWGAASPQGLAACATNELLPEVTFEFTKTNPNGQQHVYETVKLTDAMIAGIGRFTGKPGALAAVGKRESWENLEELEEWSFTFRKIEVTDADGKTTFTDDWASSA